MYATIKRILNSKPRRGSQRRGRMLKVESLEARQLMAGDLFVANPELLTLAPSAELDNGVVEVRGTGGGDKVVIEEGRTIVGWGYRSGRFYPRYANVINVQVYENRAWNPPLVLEAQFFSSEVTRLDVRAYDGEDIVENNTSFASFIDGGNGRDRLYGGESSDTIRGRDGIDLIEGRGGNDYLYGDNDHDTINGGNGTNYLYGGAGPDTLTGGPQTDYLYGGSDDDTLRGGDGRDYLYASYGNDDLDGQGGNDFLYGSYGDDELKGGAGIDYLYGQGGHDILHGGGNTDYLYGGTGNDRLFGDASSDFLFGQSGADGLYGGAGTDYLNGGSGGDRFLLLKDIPEYWWYRSDETLADLAAEDAVVSFENGAERDYAGAHLGAGNWSHAEIELLDEAFAALANRTNNAALLKEGDGDALTFVRQSTTDQTWWGSNLGGRITLNNLAFETDNRLLETVLHEVGHGFDTGSENVHWGQFLGESGWRQLNWWDSKRGFVYSGTDNWYYRSGATFVSDYARQSPQEDWGETFAAYFMDRMGRIFAEGSQGDASTIPDKIHWVDELADHLAS